MITAAIDWLKEYGDVLGGIGSITALIMLMITNGKVILQRIKGNGPRKNNKSPSIKSDHHGRTAIAILPYIVIGNSNDHFGEGLITDLITDFENTPFAVVTPTKQGETNNGNINVYDILKQTNTDYVLTTSIRVQGETRRVTAQLMNDNATVKWSHRYDASGTDYIHIQERIAAEITAAVSSALAPQASIAQSAKDVSLQQDGTINIEGMPILTDGLSLHTRNANASPKSRFVALLLCSIVGLFGVHRYYLGRPYTGLLYTFTVGIISIGWILDMILITTGMFADGDGKPVRYWTPDHESMKISDAS